MRIVMQTQAEIDQAAEVAAREAFVAQGLRRRFECDDFRVHDRVLERSVPVAGAGEYSPVTNNERPDGDFPLGGGLRGLVERKEHETDVVAGVWHGGIMRVQEDLNL